MTAQRDCYCDPACVCRIAGNCVTMSGDVMPTVTLDELDALALGCPQVGNGGRHSESYGEDGDGTCVWCGARPPPLAIPSDGEPTYTELLDTALKSDIEMVPAERLKAELARWQDELSEEEPQ
jgi:hypothetical protein